MPPGFIFDSEIIPAPQELNRLLYLCNEKTYSPKRLILAIERSACKLSIFNKSTEKLVGFVRATSDKGLNANLWNLVAEPGENQDRFISLLINRSLQVLRRDMPGCSISVAAPKFAFQALKDQGFLLDPSGIRAMGLRLR